MRDMEFISAFERQKKRFYRHLPGGNNHVTLDLFEKWLKDTIKNSKVKNGSPQRLQLTNSRLSDIFDQVVSEASAKLKERGININCVCLPMLVNKSASRCLRVQSQDSVYYRIRKTTPRKGKYKGENLISIELVADGNKNNVFIPLLSQKEEMERKLNRPIERESKAVEETGKYRIKIVSRDFFKKNEADVKMLTEMLTDFIIVTNDYLQKLSADHVPQTMVLN